MTRFTDEELDAILEEAPCNARLRYLVDDIRRERYRKSKKVEVKDGVTIIGGENETLA